jgi:hypothetical protein
MTEKTSTKSAHRSGTASAVAPGRARGCQCEQPWRDDDSCLRCGRWVRQAVPEAPRRRRSRVTGNPWTRAGVVRAIRTFEFFLDRPPTTIDWSAEDDAQWPGARTVERLFGSFEGAVAAARMTRVWSAS